MHNRTKTIRTDLYDLISAMHNAPGSIDNRIPKQIQSMAASGKIRWLMKQKAGISDTPNKLQNRHH